jgi:hypothetical protein
MCRSGASTVWRAVQRSLSRDPLRGVSVRCDVYRQHNGGEYRPNVVIPGVSGADVIGGNAELDVGAPPTVRGS